MTDRGTLYGIGVGPGDPGLMTVKARELLESAEVIAYPVNRAGGDSTALNIVKGMVDISGKEVIELVFSMNPDKAVRRRCRAEATDRVCSVLSGGRDVAVPVLGDPAIYSTYMYMDREVASRGFPTEVVPGIPAMSSGAARASVPLVMGEESLQVVPMATKDNRKAEAVLDVCDNVVFMKAFGSIPDIARMLEERGIPFGNATVMSNVGMEDEYVGPLDPGREYGYFTTVLVKKRTDRGPHHSNNVKS